jgi:hypothetical protein
LQCLDTRLLLELEEPTGVVDGECEVEALALFDLRNGDTDDFSAFIHDRTPTIAFGNRRIHLEKP